MKILDQPLLDRARDHAVAFLRDLPGRHVGPRATRDELLRALASPLSDKGEDPAAVLDLLAAQADRGVIGSAGPRYFGFVIGGAIPVSPAPAWLLPARAQNPGPHAH